jgi:hypothetical protein
LDFVHRPLKINEELIKTQRFESWFSQRPQVIKNAGGRREERQLSKGCFN